MKILQHFKLNTRIYKHVFMLMCILYIYNVYIHMHIHLQYKQQFKLHSCFKEQAFINFRNIGKTMKFKKKIISNSNYLRESEGKATFLLECWKRSVIQFKWKPSWSKGLETPMNYFFKNLLIKWDFPKLCKTDNTLHSLVLFLDNFLAFTGSVHVKAEVQVTDLCCLYLQS